jgi:hypothetical protein
MWKRDSGRPARPLSHLWGSAEDDAKILDDAAGAGGGGGRGRAVVEDFGNVIDVFQRVYPTGSFGAYLHIGGLAANLAVLFVAVCVLLPGSQYRFRYVFAAIALIPSVLEAITVLSLHPAGAARRLVRRRPGARCRCYGADRARRRVCLCRDIAVARGEIPPGWPQACASSGWLPRRNSSWRRERRPMPRFCRGDEALDLNDKRPKGKFWQIGVSPGAERPT